MWVILSLICAGFDGKYVGNETLTTMPQNPGIDLISVSRPP